MKDYSENFLNLVEGQMTAREGPLWPITKSVPERQMAKGSVSACKAPATCHHIHKALTTLRTQGLKGTKPLRACMPTTLHTQMFCQASFVGIAAVPCKACARAQQQPSTHANNANQPLYIGAAQLGQDHYHTSHQPRVQLIDMDVPRGRL